MTVVRRVFRSESAEALWSEAELAFARGDIRTAFQIFSSLADRGEWLAYAEIANLLELGGVGLERDIEGALGWYRKAVFESGDPNAHFALARLYFNGDGVSIDYEKARDHAHRALLATEPYRLAEHYQAMAYVMLAILHSKGLGVDRDIEKARNILKEGIAAGFVWPAFELSTLELKEWHLLDWFRLRLRATKMARDIMVKDPNDPRLIGLALRNKTR